MIFPNWVSDVVAKSAYWADRTMRSELSRGEIVSENDYTSNFTGMLRRQINARDIPGLVASVQLLRPTHERRFGADACIVLSNGSEHKVGLFEAKWPRLTIQTDGWDSLQRSSGTSHFHDQLRRQDVAARAGVAVWEMFYSESPYCQQPSFMPDTVSACAWHDHAWSASQGRAQVSAPWTDRDLETLLLAHGLQIDAVVRTICECHRGQVFLGQFEGMLDLPGILPAVALIVEYSQGRRQSGIEPS